MIQKRNSGTTWRLIKISSTAAEKTLDVAALACALNRRMMFALACFKKRARQSA
jgi:hypothetical protein